MSSIGIQISFHVGRELDFGECENWKTENLFD